MLKSTGSKPPIMILFHIAGKVYLDADSVVCKEGDVLTPEQCRLLVYTYSGLFLVRLGFMSDCLDLLLYTIYSNIF